MFCYKCGASLVGAGLFCQSCGAKQADKPPVQDVWSDSGTASNDVLSIQPQIPPVHSKQPLSSENSEKGERPMQLLHTFTSSGQTLNIYRRFIELKNQRYDIAVPIWSIEALQCSPSLSSLTINSGGLEIKYLGNPTAAYQAILKLMDNRQ